MNIVSPIAECLASLVSCEIHCMMKISDENMVIRTSHYDQHTKIAISTVKSESAKNNGESYDSMIVLSILTSCLPPTGLSQLPYQMGQK